MHVLVTRPEADAIEFKSEIEALGHDVTLAPMLTIECLPIDPSALENVQAIVVTSRNGLRALAASGPPAHVLNLPLFAVGPATAACAEDMGFSNIATGSGAASALVPLIASRAGPAGGPILYLAGDDVAFDLSTPLENQGFEVRKLVTYRALTVSSFAPETVRLIAEGRIDAVILMSQRTATAFSKAIVGAGLEERCRKLTCVCISQNVAQALKDLGSAPIAVAPEPNSAAILGVLAEVATRPSSV